MIEEWADIPEYIGIYQVSNFGRVRNIKKKGKIKSSFFNLKGYKYVSLSKKNKKKNFYVHRLVALCFVPNPKGKGQVNHKDFNKQNNQVDNLEWVTCAENIHHAIENDRFYFINPKKSKKNKK